MSYVLMLSLKEIALRRVIVVLWSEPDILDSIGKFRNKSVQQSSKEYQNEWCVTFENKIADKMSKLVLPKKLAKQMLHIVRPIGLQILKWKMFHEKYLTDSREEFDVPVLEKLCWTAASAVDYRKTAEELIRSDVVDIVKRYKLACLYCLEDYIPALWKELPQETKNTFYNEKDTSHIERPLLHLCWPYILKGEESKLDNLPGRPLLTTFHRYAFGYTVLNGNRAAAEYFFQKLTKEDRESCLIPEAKAAVRCRNSEIDSYPDEFPLEKLSDVLCYFLSLMNHEQQMQFFKMQPCDYFICFLDWPWQDLFLEIIALIWDFLPVDSLVHNLIKSFIKSGYYSPKIFQELFMLSPIDFKKRFLLKVYDGAFLPAFFDFYDSETIQVIFRNIDAADRAQIVFSAPILRLFYNSISRGRWRMVRVCLREATLSKKDRERFMEAFIGFLRTNGVQIKWGIPKWRRFFDFLDETDESVSRKRRLDYEALTEAIKLRCEIEKRNNQILSWLITVTSNHFNQ
ncbi:hypothetical protein AVEN_120468-1 [Araneus ventricosus]|uniref:Uncharacterized protein n=1 Tax=Araneus ventricosus TaxID=182803 RepID=A0A4Y2NNF3_ARAVE|nr:hypothetical protein AVEN_120468-1 [Araneus ventricosus]